ncbi:NAD(P)H-binding protein [Amycolatopsis sp. NPDC058986]|uniref:NAD(P)H-binding protein n=1 Tax=unclassified Amycolatopsis TaxID=2618356 RepID=UPI00366E2C21
MTILVTGATGNVGRLVVDELLSIGATAVRALTVSPKRANLPAGVEVAKGYLGKLETLPDALDGVDTVYLAPVPETVKEFTELAKKAGVKRIVVLSGEGADEESRKDPSEWFYYGSEYAVEQGGFAWTHLRPGVFMNNTLDWADQIRADGRVRAPFGQALQTPIDLRDIAAVAARALVDDAHDGKKYRLSGPAAITQVEQLHAIGEAIGRELEWEELTPDQAREYWGGQGLPEDVIEFLIDVFEKTMRTPQVPIQTVEELTGRPGCTYAQWAKENADKFT